MKGDYEMGLFKSKEEKAEIKMSKGLITRKQFAEARKQLIKAKEKGNSDPSIDIKIAMIDLSQSGNLNEMKKLQTLAAQKPGLQIKYGVHNITTDRIALECDLRYRANTMLKEASEAKESYKCTEAMGKALIDLSREYVSKIGDDAILIDEIFFEEKSTGREESLRLAAVGYETLAQAFVWNDPKKAADYATQAANYRRDLNDGAALKDDEDFVKGAAKTAKCWFCGKEVSGEGYHYIPMDAMITKPIRDILDKTESPIKTADSKCVYVCRGCYSAIDNHNKMYYNKSKAYTDEVRAELIAYINQVNERIDNLIRALNKG